MIGPNCHTRAATSESQQGNGRDRTGAARRGSMGPAISSSAELRGAPKGASDCANAGGQGGGDKAKHAIHDPSMIPSRPAVSPAQPSVQPPTRRSVLVDSQHVRSPCIASLPSRRPHRRIGLCIALWAAGNAVSTLQRGPTRDIFCCLLTLTAPEYAPLESSTLVTQSTSTSLIPIDTSGDAIEGLILAILSTALRFRQPLSR